MSEVDRRNDSRRRLNDPNTADNMAVRLEIVRRMNAGEITLAQAQAELKAIKTEARRTGRPVWHR